MQEVKLGDLPYAYDALEPIIDKEIMLLHHTKHHKAYVDNLNAALKQMKECSDQGNMRGLADAQRVAYFNAGGNFNHNFFWETLSPQKENGGKIISSAFMTTLETQFGSLQNFIEAFNKETAAIQGSGWGWLVFDKQTKHLAIVTTINQEPPRPATAIPLLGVDVWEHAYYLQYKNARAEYLKSIWGVMNWKKISERFDQAN